MFFNPAARRQLEAEIEAQFAAFAATDLALDHVNAHKHFQLHPTIASLIVKIGRRHGLKAARAPTEPRGVLVLAEPTGRYRADPVVDLCSALTTRRFRRAGLLVPDQVFGLRWSGAMTARRLRALIENLPEGLSEIYLHPATRGGFAGAAPGYNYSEELAALVTPEVIDAARAGNVRLGGFLDFAGPGAAARQSAA
jgi:hopanoid biosynthesis associated protein HpnK